MSRRAGRTPLLAALLALSACTPTLHEYEPRTGVIRGTLLYPSGESRGNAIVLLFAADDPPPPLGTGSPINFVVVPKAQLFGDAPAGEARDFATEFTIPTVPAGRYIVAAFLDADEDFNPIYGLLAQPTAGDVSGGYVDAATGELLPLEVQADRVEEHSVLVVLARPIPVERPAFELTSSRSFSVPLARPARLSLQAHPVQREQVRMDPARTAFLIRYVDENRDGQPDDANGDHLPDVYPRVLLRKRPQPGDPGAVVVPLIIDPYRYREALVSRGSTTARSLELIVPPVAVAIGPGGARSILPAIPPGEYSTVVISGTGQTWEVPNDLDLIQPGEIDPTQSQPIVMSAGPPLPSGHLGGVVRVPTDAEADAFVFAFNDMASDALSAEPPVAAIMVPRGSFSPISGGREAPFSFDALPAGRYVVRALYDVDHDFSLLVPLVAQASAGDLIGSAGDAIVLFEAEPVEGVVVEASQIVPFERPAFRLTGGTPHLVRSNQPQVIELETHANDALAMDPVRVRFPVTLAGGDSNSDNLPDLTPWVILTRMVDAGDPRTAADDSERIIIPAVVETLPFLPSIDVGNPLVPAERLRVIVPPYALRLGAGTIEPLTPPPPGRYRVTLVTPFSQAWSVPSDLDFALGRAGSAAADPSQAEYVEIGDQPVPAGAIRGSVRLAISPPSSGFEVLILAFHRDDPPPPAGFGRPVASAIVSRTAFAGTATAAYELRGLPTGVYQLRAFLDANQDFVPWYPTRNQPTAGDTGGGHLVGPVLGEVTVDALGGPTTGVDVTIAAPLAFTFDRPLFVLAGGSATLRPASGPLAVSFVAQSAASSVLSADGVFPVQWVDLDANGAAEDVTFDGQPDVFPLVVAELLDPADPSDQTPAPARTLILGIIDPNQFLPLGFPAGDPTAVQAQVIARQMTVLFPPVAIDAAIGRPINPAPAGRYRITLVNARGQTWTVPNELVRAIGDPLATSQAAVLSVVP